MSFLIRMISVFGLFICPVPVFAQGGGSGGNGLHGILIPNNKTVLYDLYQSGVNADQLLRTLKPNYQRNIGIEKALEKIGPFYEFAPKSGFENSFNQALVIFLDQISEMSPSLFQRMMSELKMMRWKKSEKDLLPDLDVKSFALSRNVGAIACTHKRYNPGETLVIYSPSCSGNKMSVASKAVMVIRESIQSASRRILQDMNLSTNMKSLLQALTKLMPISPRINSIDEVKKIMFDQKLGTVSEEDQKIRETWRMDSHYSFSAKCDIDNKESPINQINIEISRGFEISGMAFGDDTVDSNTSIAREDPQRELLIEALSFIPTDLIHYDAARQSTELFVTQPWGTKLRIKIFGATRKIELQILHRDGQPTYYGKCKITGPTGE